MDELKPSEDLRTRCSDILEWRQTGSLPFGAALRAFAEQPRFDRHESDRLRAAEDATLHEAATLIAKWNTRAASGGEALVSRPVAPHAANNAISPTVRATIGDSASLEQRAHDLFWALMQAPYADTTIGNIVCAETTPQRLESAWIPLLTAALANQQEVAVGAYPTGSDREVLQYLMQQFDVETWQCPSCGHAEDTASMDSADYLRKYLAEHPAEQQGVGGALPAPARTREMEKDAGPFYAACQRACAELPNGWEIRVCLEKDAGTVELCDPDGGSSYMDVDADDRLTAEVHAAIDAAMATQPAGDMGREEVK